ncbi:MAG: hypothetical protein HZB24_09280 [Desulfobacterales bacterium]|nr:hypothetical protein [Desulfobacterales bacterium]
MAENYYRIIGWLCLSAVVGLLIADTLPEITFSHRGRIARPSGGVAWQAKEQQ